MKITTRESGGVAIVDLRGLQKVPLCVVKFATF
jgi:hypothetical protein